MMVGTRSFEDLGKRERTNDASRGLILEGRPTKGKRRVRRCIPLSQRTRRKNVLLRMRHVAKVRSSLDRDQLDVQPSLIQILLLAQHGFEVIRDVLGPPDHLDRTRLWVDPLELGLGQTAAVDEEFDSDEVSSAELVGREKTDRSVRTPF